MYLKLWHVKLWHVALTRHIQYCTVQGTLPTRACLHRMFIRSYKWQSLGRALGITPSSTPTLHSLL